ncbi:MAG TPA: hypothetical protein DIT99_09435 [Candidatus Latescibacteria bacterium]|nr:hypothetical protein [Candidatus Latescibacterota bacterium]
MYCGFGRFFVDDRGLIYITDTGNHRIRKINGAGIITTIAGSGATGIGTGSFYRRWRTGYSSNT